MNNRNAIHRAAQSRPAPSLPTGFQARLTARIKAERRREERQEKLSYIAMGVTAFALLIYAVTLAAQRIDLSWTLSLFNPERWRYAKLWGFIAALICAMLTLDSYIRQRIYLQQIRKSLLDKNKQQRL